MKPQNAARACSSKEDVPSSWSKGSGEVGRSIKLATPSSLIFAKRDTERFNSLPLLCS